MYNDIVMGNCIHIKADNMYEMPIMHLNQKVDFYHSTSISERRE